MFTFEGIITSCNEIFKEFEWDIAVQIEKLANSAWKTVKCYVGWKLKVDSWTLTLKLQARKSSELIDIACVFVKLYTTIYWKDWLLITQCGNNVLQFRGVSLTEPLKQLSMSCWRSLLGACCDAQYCPYRWPIVWLSVNAFALPLDYTKCSTNNRSYSVDDHFQEAVAK